MYPKQYSLQNTASALPDPFTPCFWNGKAWIAWTPSLSQKLHWVQVKNWQSTLNLVRFSGKATCSLSKKFVIIPFNPFLASLTIVLLPLVGGLPTPRSCTSKHQEASGKIASVSVQIYLLFMCLTINYTVCCALFTLSNNNSHLVYCLRGHFLIFNNIHSSRSSNLCQHCFYM